MALEDIVGQDGVLRALKSAVERRRSAAAYLFHGPSGTGKFFAALNFAKALNCVSGKDVADACDHCPSCTRIEAESHPDVMIVRPEKGIIRIEEIRKLEEALAFRSYEGGYKVAIVDEAHLMNVMAANAFLKCLEEPPQGSVIVLASSNPERLPETVRSRCLALRFRPLSADQMEIVVRDRVKDPQKRRALIGLSMGRPGLAIDGGEDILKRRRQFVKSLLSMLDGGRTSLWAGKEDVEDFMDGLELFLRDALVFNTTGREDLLLGWAASDGGGWPEKLKSMGRSAKKEVIIDCYRRVSGIRESMVYNPNKSILWNYTAGMLGRLAGGGTDG